MVNIPTHAQLDLFFCSNLESREQMDRRHLEEAFLQYAILKMASWYRGIKADKLTMDHPMC